MKNLLKVFIASSVISAAFTASAEPVLNAGPGYIVRPFYTRSGDPGSYTSGIQSFDYDDSGDCYVLTQNRYVVKNPQWSPQTLYDYGSGAYGSFLKVLGDTVYLGNTTFPTGNGTVKSVPTGGGAAFTLFTLAGNFDCAFNSQSGMFLSANPGGFTGENRIYYWDGQTEAMVLAEMGKYSGPVAFDRDDNLYYGFSDFPAGPEDVVYFTASQVANAIATQTPLTSADWTVYASGVDAPSGFAFDSRSSLQQLFASSTTGSVNRIFGSDAFNLFGTGSSPSFLRFAAGGSNFDPFTPDGGSLSVLGTDWLDYSSTVFRVDPCCQNFILGGADHQAPGQSEITVFRPGTGLWAIRDLTRTYFGAGGDLPVSADYDGDALAEAAIFRPELGLWASAGVSRFYYGAAGDIPLPRDYDGSGTYSAAVFRPATGLWAVRELTRVYLGAKGDFPVPGDYEGSGDTSLACFRPSEGLWQIRGLSAFYFGSAGDLPVPGDYAGDGTMRPAIFRPATGLWAVRDLTRIYFGSASSGDTPVPVDFEGDGTLEPAVFRSPTGLWALRGVTRLYFGGGSDFPASR